jgi:hypothetical protein
MSGFGDDTPIRSDSAPTGPGDNEPPRRLSPASRLREWLSHPLLLLLIGALISSILVPSLTRQWQNHEKELEMKSGLVEDMNNSVTDFVMAVQFAEVGATSQSQADYDKAYRDWEIKRGQLASKIRVYFPASRIADEWSRYSRAVTDFYVLSGIREESRRAGLVSRLANYFGQGDLQALAAGPPDDRRSSQYQRYVQAWEILKDRILSKKDEFINDILRSSSALS